MSLLSSTKIHNVILDCNVWLDWLLFNDSCVQWAKQMQSDRVINLIATEPMRSELLDVLQRPSVGLKFISRSSFHTIEAMMGEFDSRVSLLPTPELALSLALPQCKDKDDQMFVELAVSSQALLVTKDKALLALASKLRKFHQISVGTPSAIAKLIANAI
jgi:putative PIN family toxin of toxin-antitoxin system